MKKSRNKILDVSNEFITSVRIQPTQEQKRLLQRYINLHYLGDVDCNRYDEHDSLVSKYPEKETQEYKDAMHRLGMTKEYRVKVIFDVNGNARLKLFDGDNDVLSS